MIIIVENPALKKGIDIHRWHSYSRHYITSHLQSKSKLANMRLWQFLLNLYLSEYCQNFEQWFLQIYKIRRLFFMINLKRYIAILIFMNNVNILVALLSYVTIANWLVSFWTNDFYSLSNLLLWICLIIKEMSFC